MHRTVAVRRAPQPQRAAARSAEGRVRSAPDSQRFGLGIRGSLRARTAHRPRNRDARREQCDTSTTHGECRAQQQECKSLSQPHPLLIRGAVPLNSVRLVLRAVRIVVGAMAVAVNDVQLTFRAERRTCAGCSVSSHGGHRAPLAGRTRSFEAVMQRSAHAGGNGRGRQAGGVRDSQQ